MKKSIIGSGGGAIIGFTLGGPIGAAIGAGIGFLGGNRMETPHGMTPERKQIFEEALKTLKDPVALKKLADGFQSEGLTAEAALLRKRAGLRELPAEQKAQRKLAFRKAMSVGKDGTPVTEEQIAVVEKMAATFQEQGATGNAATLRQHAQSLRKLFASKKPE